MHNFLWPVWHSGSIFRRMNEVTLYTLSPVSTEMSDRPRAGIPPPYVTKPTRSTQLCIPLGSLNRVGPTSFNWLGERWGMSALSDAWKVTGT